MAQRRHDFIVDVCDGDRRRAERLIMEKQQLHSQLEYELVLQLVCQDMLELTAEERAAAYAGIRDADKRVLNDGVV